MGDAGQQRHQQVSPAQNFQMFTPSLYNPGGLNHAGQTGNEGSNNGFSNKLSNGSQIANGKAYPQDASADQSSQYGQPDGNASTSAAGGGQDQQPTKFSRSKGVRVHCLPARE